MEGVNPVVLVIGLGPAGASAAAEAARRGCRVLAIDRKREAGRPVQCAEFVPAMVGIDVVLAFRNRCADCNHRAHFRCDRCRRTICANHGTVSKGFTVVCKTCPDTPLTTMVPSSDRVH